jgi:hypothetical protein
MSTRPVGPAPRRTEGITEGESTDGALLTFPADFPIKIMGRRVDGFADAIVALVRMHVTDFDERTVELRASSKGNYIGMTITVRATSREQLDALYQALTSHALVSVVL